MGPAGLLPAADRLAVRLRSSARLAQSFLAWGIGSLAVNRARPPRSQSPERGPAHPKTTRPSRPRKWSTSRSQFVSTSARLQNRRANLQMAVAPDQPGLKGRTEGRMGLAKRQQSIATDDKGRPAL